jgi:iron complex outermembrane receptor protein
VACGGRPCAAGLLAPGYSQGFYQYGTLDTDAGAVFGNVYYRVTDQLGVRLGARYSKEKKAVNELSKTDLITPWPPYLPMFPPPTPGASYARQITSRTYKAFTPSVIVDYKPAENIYLYASWSKGFKSGGFNLGNAQPAFAPEKITDYEVGLKADWLDRRLRTNLAGFYYDYTDVQLSRVQGVPPAIVIFNAPGAKLKGFEAEVTAIPFDHARVEIGYGFIDSKYSAPFTTVDSARPWLGTLNLAGNELTQAPRNTLNLGAEYEWPVAAGKVTLRAETQYKSRVYFSPFNLSYVSQPAHWTSNAFLTFQSGDEKFRASLWVRNIENGLVRASESVTTGFFGAPLYGAYEPPRTYGVEVGYRY